MSTVDPAPNFGEINTSLEGLKSNEGQQEKGRLSTRTTSFTQTVNIHIKEEFVATLRPFLLIIRVTAIFIFAVLADTLVIMIIKWSFGGIINHNFFAAELLEGIQILSALGTAVAYILYLISSLFKDAKHLFEEIRVKDHQDKVSI